MGFVDAIKGQFIDVIEFVDNSNKLIVSKYQRESGNNELKQGSKVIVRESQCAVFLKGGRIADIMGPGTYSLTTDNFPVLSSLEAFPHLFVSPIISDVYFISTKQFVGNKWATKNPIMMRDKDFNMARIRAFGQYSFRIVDVPIFMKEVFGTKGMVLTYDIVSYLSSIVAETFAVVVGESEMPVLDLATKYSSFSGDVQQKVNERARALGIEFSDIIIENISLPDEVEKLIDEQSGIGMASKNMDAFMQYQTARAMRDASMQEGGLAGLGAGLAVGKNLAMNIDSNTNGANANNSKSKADQLRELKSLLDEGILTQEEFDQEKKTILERS
jgi:membrane protease subunit (stomatin/prohibitin family)